MESKFIASHYGHLQSISKQRQAEQRRKESAVRKRQQSLFYLQKWELIKEKNKRELIIEEAILEQRELAFKWDKLFSFKVQMRKVRALFDVARERKYRALRRAEAASLIVRVCQRLFKSRYKNIKNCLKSKMRGALTC